MTEQTPDERRDGPASGGTWGDAPSGSTRAVRAPAADDQPTTVSPAPLYPPPGREEPGDPYSPPTPAAGNPPVGAPIGDSARSADRGADDWSPAYSAQPGYDSQPAVTSVYPPSTPGYAPTGYPAAYAPPVAVPAPASAVVEATPSARVGPGFLAALIGLVLSAGGVYLAARFGVAAAKDIGEQKMVLKDSGLAALGAILLFGAVALNGWSPWATIIPGLALTGMGGWALFSVAGATHFADWTKSVFSTGQLATWNIFGFSLVLGLVMLGAGIAVAVARASGKRDGRILGSRPV